jgi:hypothetical protein
MKKFTLFTIISLAIITNYAHSQDYMISTSDKKIECKIHKLTEDSIFFTMKVNGSSVESSGPVSQVKDFGFGIIENLKQNFDTASFYTVILNDKTKLYGQIVSVEKAKITINDVMLKKLTINAFIIQSFEKESEDALYLIKLKNGSEIKGIIVERRKNEIDVKTDNLGTVTISYEDIKSKQVIDSSKVIDGEYWFDNPNNTRYLFAPSAMNLEKGEGYYQCAYFLGNSVNYGLTDNISIGGIVILPVAALITPKIGFQIAKKFHLGAGVIMGILPGPSFAGIVYGVATFGSKNNNITFGPGYGFYEDQMTQRPILTFNGMTRVSRKISLVTENWFLPFMEEVWNDNYNDYTMVPYYFWAISYGVRIMNEKFSFDISLVNTKETFEILPIGIPYIDFVYKF